MSLRRFNGWEPQRIHEHQYDTEGRLVRTIVTSEPEWDDEQRTIALEDEALERQTCPGCGGHYAHTLDSTVGRDVQTQHFQCLDCKAIGEARKAHHKKNGHTDERCNCDDFMVWVDKYVPRPA